MPPSPEAGPVSNSSCMARNYREGKREREKVKGKNVS
jgi:hypothetical protein